MTSKERLRVAETGYREAYTRSEEMRAKRNAEVRQALAEGWTHAAIAEATGLTRGRVGQIAMADKHAA